MFGTLPTVTCCIMHVKKIIKHIRCVVGVWSTTIYVCLFIEKANEVKMWNDAYKKKQKKKNI